VKSKIIAIALTFTCLILMLGTASAASILVYKDVEDIAGHGDTGYVAREGDVIKYTIGVVNTGDQDLTNIKVSDPSTILEGPFGNGSDEGVIPPGETWNYEGTHTVTKTDISKGNGLLKNTLTVIAKQISTKSATATVRIVHS
jgi:hypothetical protein